MLTATPAAEASPTAELPGAPKASRACLWSLAAKVTATPVTPASPTAEAAGAPAAAIGWT